MENLPDAVFTGLRVLDPATGADCARDIAVADGRFVDPADAPAGARRIDASGLVATPGLRDVHVHFRDPGAPEAETAATGAAAAAAGGFTCVTTMPNTSPACDSPAMVRAQIEARGLAVRIMPSACITAGRLGREPADLEALAAAGAAAFTDDGSFVSDAGVMRAAMARAAALGKPVMQHAVMPSILAGGVIRRCALSRRLGLPEMPPEAETEAVRRDIALCRETGCALHIQHISCAGTLDLIRAARAEGLPVTGEATPHHLFFSADDIPADDSDWKMAPPLGTDADRAALRRAVIDGVITVFATDHAPHSAKAKEGGFLKAANGITGLETALAATWTVMVEGCGMRPLDWAARWTLGPAALLGESAPSFATGAVADFTIFDPRVCKAAEKGSFRSKSNNTPFAGTRLRAWPVLTVCQGRATHGSEILRQG